MIARDRCRVRVSVRSPEVAEGLHCHPCRVPGPVHPIAPNVLWDIADATTSSGESVTATFDNLARPTSVTDTRSVASVHGHEKVPAGGLVNVPTLELI